MLFFLQLTKELAPPPESFDPPKSLDPLQESINDFINLVNDRIFDEEQWQLWEKFGACYHAMKINSFVRLGITEISIGELHQGADLRPEIRDIRVKLKPVKVIRSGTPMNPKLEPVLRSFRVGSPFDWTNFSYVVLNAPDGEGIDIWTCYEGIVDGTVIVDADQRKAISKPAQTEILKEIVEKAFGILPDEVKGKRVVKIIGCMMITSERKTKEPKLSKPKSKDLKPSKSKQLTIPESTYLVTKRQGGSLSWHFFILWSCESCYFN